MARKKKDTELVGDALHAAQEKGYLGARPADAPSFESQTVAGVLAGDNIEEAKPAPIASPLEDTK